jgi:hypothetical protein
MGLVLPFGSSSSQVWVVVSVYRQSLGKVSPSLHQIQITVLVCPLFKELHDLAAGALAKERLPMVGGPVIGS